MSKDIIALADGSTQYIDDSFYQSKMGETTEKSGSSYPVKMVCLQVDWIIYDEKTSSMSRDGHKFLQSIAHSNDLDFFSIISLQILIEFFYL